MGTSNTPHAVVEKLAECYLSLDNRVRLIEECLGKLCHNVTQIHAVVAEPSGFLTFKGAVASDPKEIEELLTDGVALDMGDATIQFKYTQAFYAAMSPNLSERIGTVLSEGQLKYLLSIVESYSRVDKLLGLAEQRAHQAEDNFQKTMVTLQEEHAKLAATSSRKITELFEKKIRELKKEEDFVEKARSRLECAIKKAEGFAAQKGNEVKASNKLSGKIEKR